MISDKPYILIVEDDVEIATFLTSSLRLNGYMAICSSSLAAAFQQFADHKPLIIILDLTLPDGDGKTFISKIRSNSDLPIIVLSAKQSEQEKVQCFDLGADDYLAKPFGVQELMARIRVNLKRSEMMTLRDDVYQVDGLEINIQN